MNKKLPWLRLYSNTVDDEKIRLLGFDDRWHFIAILCLKQQGILEQQNDLLERKIAIKLGVNISDLEEIKSRLIEVDLIDEGWNPISWNKCQFKSDVSTERVRNYREKRKKKECNGNETLPKRKCNALDTDTDTDTDTDIPPIVPQGDGPQNETESEPDKKTEFRLQANQVIDHLNAKTNSSYRYSKTTLTPIVARLNEGFTVDDLCLVVDAKTKQWGGSQQAEFLRPKTLFGATNFEGYLQSAKRGDHEASKQFCDDRPKSGALILAESTAKAFGP